MPLFQLFYRFLHGVKLKMVAAVSPVTHVAVVMSVLPLAAVGVSDTAPSKTTPRPATATPPSTPRPPVMSPDGRKE
ncbi:hypothetical protein ACOMHN_028947 [Nucella lapillus]